MKKEIESGIEKEEIPISLEEKELDSQQKNPETTNEDEPETSIGEKSNNLDQAKIGSEEAKSKGKEEDNIEEKDPYLNKEKEEDETNLKLVEEKPIENLKSIAKKKEIEELKKMEEEEIIEPAKPLHNLPGEKEACKGSSGYNLDNIDELEGAMASESKPLEAPKMKKKLLLNKPSFKPK